MAGQGGPKDVDGSGHPLVSTWRRTPRIQRTRCAAEAKGICFARPRQLRVNAVLKFVAAE